MNGFEYVDLAMRTNDGKSTSRLTQKILHETALDNFGNAIANTDVLIGDLLNGCLGLTGETGEFCDMVKKFIFHEKEMDFEHLKKELGDVMWYVAMICHAMHWNLDEILAMNVEKLKARYPEGFDVERANNRNIDDV